MISQRIRQQVLAIRQILRWLLPVMFAVILIVALYLPAIRVPLFVTVILALLAAEIVLRCLGLLDFPLYDANNVIGYIPRANQQGRFLRKNDWRFNALHMDAGSFVPDPSVDTLLIGDSVVLGGTLYPSQHRLGACLQSLLPGSVWPVAAGSWGLLNALTYLHLHADIVKQVRRIVLVVNSEDFGPASSWSCELRHPRRKPVSAVLYFLQRYIYAEKQLPVAPVELQVPAQDIGVAVRALLQCFAAQQIVFVLYPQYNEICDPHALATRLECHRASLQAMGVTDFITVAGNARWDVTCYRDHIHPTAMGNQRLAQIIADYLML